MANKRLAQALLDDVLAGGGSPSRLSVVGICKNAGKTVALNHLIRAAAERELPLGLVSTGRDGEDQDAITEMPKPRIWAPAGAYVATATRALTVGSAQVETLSVLPMNTPFGRMVIGRVRQPGELLLIGPGTASRIGTVLQALEAEGAQLSLVDGSFDRLAAAAPAVTGQVVLAAGAAYSHSMAETVAQVAHLRDIFDLPAVPEALAPLVEMATAPVTVITPDGELQPLPVVSALADPEPIVAAAAQVRSAHLVINGAVSDRLVMALLRNRLTNIPLIVGDATHVLLDRNLWRRWRRQGGVAAARRPVRLAAITTNPHSPVGLDYDAREFHAQVAENAGRPVYDLEAGLPEVLA